MAGIVRNVAIEAIGTAAHLRHGMMWSAHRLPIAAGKLNHIVQDLSILHAMGLKLVLVHGFRPQVNEQLAAKGHVSRYHNGLRVTDGFALDAAQEAAGQLRFGIEAAFSQGLPNTSMAA